MSPISTLKDLLLNLSPVFTAPSMTLFTTLVVGWIVCPGRRTVNGLMPYVDPDRTHAHDAYHRFFRAGAWGLAHLFRLWSAVLVEALAPRSRVLTLATDDTVHKKTGPWVEGAKWLRDAVRSTSHRVVHVWGLNLVVLSLRVKPPWKGEPLALPLNVRLYLKDGPTLLDLVAQMIEELAAWFPTKRFYLVADGLYAPLAGRDLPRTHLISRMRADAALYERPPKRTPHQRGRSRKRGARLPAPKVLAGQVRAWRTVRTDERGRRRSRRVYVREVLWYGVQPNRPVRLVISRDPSGHERDDYFFTTDLGLSGAAVVSAYADRWAIEDTFRNVKQFLGAEEPQTWKGAGPSRAAAFAYFLYGLVWVWFLTHGHRSQRLTVTPWYPTKSRPSFRDALAALRIALWRQRFFETVPKGAQSAKFVAPLIEALARAA
jgi:hypothetical protein